MKKLITFLLVCASVSSVFSAIREDGKTFEGFWISEASEKAYGGKFVVMKFRRTFELDKVPQKCYFCTCLEWWIAWLTRLADFFVSGIFLRYRRL